MNKVILFGRIGKDPEIKTAGETKICNISLATNENYTSNGQKVEHTEWHKCVAFGKTADIIAQYVKKGDQLLIEGKIKTNSYEKNGETKYITNVIIERFEFVAKADKTAQSKIEPKNLETIMSQDDDLPF